MEFVRLSSPDHELYPRAMELYRLSFPPHEQREPRSQGRILGESAYHFDLIWDGPRFLGLMLYWEAPDFLYVEHFCIDPDARGQGLGEQALALLARKGKTVVLEIDPPVDPLSRRREGFYQRSGYHANGFPHVHPPYHPNTPGHTLVVMSYPRPLSEEGYARFDAYLKGTVMGH